MRLAAQALAVGYGDPLAVIAGPPDLVAIEAVVIEEAGKLIEQQWQHRFDYLAAKTSGLTARRILKGLGKMLGGKG